MESSPLASGRPLRYAVYLILITTAVASMLGRTMSVKSDRGKTPFLCANDRSRWATVRALGDLGHYSLDPVIFSRPGKRDPEWYTIDLVRHRGKDGREHYYSSKPPLFPTMLAAQYWLIKRVTGATLVERPFFVGRLMLVITNIVPLILYFVVLTWLLERSDTSDWVRLFTLSAAAWGTFLTTFAVTLNNHLPAAISVTFTLLAAYQVFFRGDSRGHWYALAGFASAFAAANELPALSFFCLCAVGFAARSLRQTVVWFIPSAGLVAVAFFATSYLAHGTLRPAYAHRKDGPAVVSIPLPAGQTAAAAQSSPDWLDDLRTAGARLSPRAVIRPSARPQRWVVWDPEVDVRWALACEGDALVMRTWDNWYEYEGSYWLPSQVRGVDRGEPSRWVYAFHVLIGHRGVFSLTPLWLLSLAGMLIWLRVDDRRLRVFAGAVLLLTVVSLAFYLLRPLSDRNYGGVACGFRWVFWCTPLWLCTMLPAVEVMRYSRAGRLAAWFCLAWSTFSASYSCLDPWSHPWIFDLWTSWGWLHY